MRITTALGISIGLFVMAGLFYALGNRWAGYGTAFLNIPVWLFWLRSKLK